MRTVYVNGEYLPADEAKISIFDRGFLFADAIYEVTSVLEGKLIDFDGHIARMHRSLAALDMRFALEDDALLEIHHELIARNALDMGLIYLQVTRGAADRDFLFPPDDVPCSLVQFPQHKNLLANPLHKRGQKICTINDLRWGRCDIKTVQLLFPSMAKMQAKAQGCDDAWLTRDGTIMEGTSNNAYIVKPDGTIVTRQLSEQILAGITRHAVLQCADELQMKVEERPFTLQEAKTAEEAFSSSASAFVCPVVEIDGAVLGTGKPGPVTQRISEIYLELVRKRAV